MQLTPTALGSANVVGKCITFKKIIRKSFAILPIIVGDLGIMSLVSVVYFSGVFSVTV